MYAMFMSHSQFADLRMAIDKYGIYRQRRLLSRFMPIVVYRGYEWWHG